ncbi:Fic family protein [Dyadobacter sp. CY312]|uniref:Fic family protein n=1 Tax=Dyadobacter sp. CY312 TaxID=2907303 RepID=UPI0038D39F69
MATLEISILPLSLSFRIEVWIFRCKVRQRLRILHIKNHSFVDGNKRIAAACFLLFLENNDILKKKSGALVISNEALASLTLFAAAGKPEEMETVKKLIISVLNRNH